MPLITYTERNGEILLMSDGDFRITCMVLAAAMDSNTGPFKGRWQRTTIMNAAGIKTGKGEHDYPQEPLELGPGDCWRIATYPYVGATPLGHDPYVLKTEHKFKDARDGEIIHFLPGDGLVAFRGH